MASRPDHDQDAEIKARQNMAGRFGFGLGCVAAIAAVTINLWRLPRPWVLTSLILAVLLAMLNIPLGIALGLAGERFSRPQKKE